MGARAREGGFRFAFPALDGALSALAGIDKAGALESTGTAVLSLHYNRACPVCRWEVDIYDGKAKSAGIPMTLCDTGEQPEALSEWGLGPEDIKRRMYVLGPDGKLRGGAAAFAVVWSAIPSYRRRAKLIRLPGVRQLAAAIYDGILAPTLAAWNARRNSGPSGDFP